MERQLAGLDESAGTSPGILRADADSPRTGTEPTWSFGDPPSEVTGAQERRQQGQRKEQSDEYVAAASLYPRQAPHSKTLATPSADIRGGVLGSDLPLSPTLGSTAIVGQHAVTHPRAALLLFLHSLTSDPLVLNVPAEGLSI